MAMLAALAAPAAAAPQNVQVTGPAPDQFDLSSQMAVNPQNTTSLAVAFARDAKPSTAGLQNCWLAVSSSGGALGSWSEIKVVGNDADAKVHPLPNGTGEGTPGCQSPGVAYSPSGTTLYYVFQAPVRVIGNGGRFDYGFLYFTRSNDGGQSWSTPLLINADNPRATGSGATGGDWYPHISVDTKSASPGNLYVSWVRYNQGFGSRGVAAAFSTNGGASFSSSCATCTSTPVSPPGQTIAGMQ
ncbi:MAG: glycoside hydrolase, partial [Actinobacteria bacterium]|nr:glycoside hydrolase [Actinomycetota bacterium]